MFKTQVQFLHRRLAPFLQAARRAGQNRRLRLAGQVLVLLLCAVYLAYNLFQARELLAQVRLRPGPLIAAWLLSGFSVCLGALAWWLLLRGLGQPVGWLEGLRSHLRSNLAKYVPGYAWQLVGKAYLARGMGVPSKTVGLGMTLELSQLVLIGAGLAAGLLPGETAARWVGPDLLATLPILRPALAAAIGIFILALPLLLQRTGAVQPGLPSLLTLWGATLSILLGWLLFGLSFWLLGASFRPLALAELPLFTFALAVSFILGLAVIFVPGSIGVRESLMVFILGPQLGGAVAVLIAAVSRLVILLGEFAAAGVFELLARKPAEK